MKLEKLLQLIVIAGGGLWASLVASGVDNWFTTALGWFYIALFALVGLGIAVVVILWVLKMIGVIAVLPWALERKLTDPDRS